MKVLARWLLLVPGALLLFGCDSDGTAPPIGDQRAALQSLHIVGGTGSGAYFQLFWPHVDVARADRDIYSAPEGEAFATLESWAEGRYFPADEHDNHEWFATSKAPWIHADGRPYRGMFVSSFYIRSNQTHTLQPSTIASFESGGNFHSGLARFQTSRRRTPHPIVIVNHCQPYVGGGEAPELASVDDAAGMVELYASMEGPDLAPLPDELSLFGLPLPVDERLEPAARAHLEEFGRTLIVAAKALRSDQSMSIAVPFRPGDPHGAFNSSNLPGTELIAETLQGFLNGFHDLLAELERQDQVLITIHGDTMKNPLSPYGWPDGTPGGGNPVYVVGKGYLNYGWFGGVNADGTVDDFDAMTGDSRENASLTNENRFRTIDAIAFAIARGNADAVENEIGGGPLESYAGLVR